MLEKIEAVLDEKIRPQLALHGGNIQTVSCEGGVYRFRLLGQCAGCPSADLTTESIIRQELLAAIPELTAVVLEQGVSDDLLAQARALMGRHHG